MSNKMTKKQKEAFQLFDSPRGRYILGQALYLAIEKLKEVPSEFQEKSNIADMELLKEIFFPYIIVEQAKSIGAWPVAGIKE